MCWQLRVFDRSTMTGRATWEEQSVGGELLSVVVDEESMIHLLGRRSYSGFLHRRLLQADAHRPGASEEGGGRQTTPAVVKPRAREVEEYGQVLARLVSLLQPGDSDEAAAAEGGGGLQLRPIPKHEPVETGPRFSFSVGDYQVGRETRGRRSAALLSVLCQADGRCVRGGAAGGCAACGAAGRAP